MSRVELQAPIAQEALDKKAREQAALEKIDAALPEFTPMPWTLHEIREQIPPHLFVRKTWKSLFYAARDFVMAGALWWAATYIDPTFKSQQMRDTLTPYGAEAARWASWGVYWWFQGLIFTGIWVIGHESGHGAFSASKRVCDIVGFVTHSLMWTPYFSWRISHHRHHSNHASMERDEVYVPKTREILGIPAPDQHIDWEEYFGDTPIYTMYMLIRQQVLAFPAYLLYNVSGNPKYPKYTNHFDPDSILFRPSQRNEVILSNIGLLTVGLGVYIGSQIWGFSEVCKYYLIPWLEVSHWFIMITYLHHTDPLLPHYRNKEWSYQRGAAATMDRDILGWQGRFFLHDVARYHVIHHFFPQLPWYNGEEATKYLKDFIGEHYNFSDKPAFSALWHNYNVCQFVDDDGDVLFYRDKQGQALRKTKKDN